MKYIDKKSLEALAQLTEKSGKSLVSEISKIYIETSPSAIESMKKALFLKDFETLCREAHTLKSSSMNVGAMDISKISEKIEMIFVNEEPMDQGEVLSMIRNIERILPFVMEELKPYMSY